MLKVVGTIIIENRKLLLNQPRKRAIYQLIAGKIEQGETPLQAIYREASEEIMTDTLNPNAFEFLMEFEETASSDPNLKIHYYLFNYKDKLLCEPQISDEIANFLWYDTSIKDIELSPTLKNVVIPYLIKNGLID